MSDVVQRIDRLLADLKAHYDQGGMTYGQAVIIDEMIAAFERIRAARAAEDGSRDADRRLDGGRPR